MKVSYHAVERFLQRVMQKKSIKKDDIYLAYKFLEAETKDIVLHGNKKFFRLPSFKNYVAVVTQNTVVTILPKEYLHHV